MRKPESHHVEVDMVPLIDIISLLLMFLIIVGDTTASSNLSNLRLPTASEAKKEWAIDTENRIVLQLKPEYDNENDQATKHGKYTVIFNAARHANDADDQSLKNHLASFIANQDAHGLAAKRADGTWNIQVKLRIPALCPMVEAEKVLNVVAGQQLTSIQYATADIKK